MKKLFNFIACLALASMGLAAPAMAADAVLTGPGLVYTPNLYLYQARVVDLTTAYTNATTSPTIIASATGTTAVTVPLTTRDFSKQYIRVCYSVDITKATATTGGVEVFVNGAVAASSLRYTSSAAVRNSISGCYTVARTSAAAQTVAIYGVSGDTNTMTINAAYIEVWNVQLGG